MGILEVPAINERGESNWPDRWPIDLLQAKKMEIGSIAFSSQFMLDPVDLESAFLKPQWLQYYLDEDLPSALMWFIGVDPSPSGRLGTDQFGLSVLGVDEHRQGYLASAYHLQIDPLEQAARIKAEAAVWRPVLINIEAVAAQTLFTRYMLRDANLPIRESNTRFPKAARVIAMAVVFENGKVKIRGTRTPEGTIEPADSVQDFVTEFSGFPNTTDDVLDAAQKALEAAQLMSGNPIMVTTHPDNIPGGRSPRPAFASGSRLFGPKSPFQGRRLRDSFRRRRRLR